MYRLRLAVAAIVGLCLIAATASAQEPSIAAAHGAVGKSTKDTLNIKPRGADGKFEKEMVLQLTGTSKVTTLTIQMRAGKPTPVQQDVDVKDLKANQAIAVIYTQGAGGPVLLTAVVLPPK